MSKFKIICGLLVLSIIGVGLVFINGKKTRNILEGKSINLASIPQKLMRDVEEDPRSENPVERIEFEMGQLVNPKTGLIPENILQEELIFAKNRLNLKEDSPYGVSPFSLDGSPSSVAQNSENFVNTGPYNIGGRTRAIVIDAADEDVLIAGGVSGGVWKSTDQGQSWNRTSALEQHPAVTSIVQDRRSGKTNEWYYSTGEFSGNSASGSGAFYLGNGIYKSTDNGESWEQIASTVQPGTSDTDVITTAKRFTIIDQLAIDNSESSGTEIYAAGLSEIIRSSDGFETFEVVLGESNSGNNFADVAVSSTGKVYASIANTSFNGVNGEDGLFKSDDGINWTQIEPTTNFPSSFRRFEIAIDPNNEDRVYFLSDDRLFVYTESTDSWADVSANIKVSGEDVGAGHDSQGGYNLYVAVHPQDEDIVFLGGINLMRTINSFASESGTSQVGGYNNDNNPNSYPRYPNHHPDNHGYAFFPSNPDKMISATDGGLHLTENNTTTSNTTNPITWSSLNNGYITTQFYHASIHLFDYADPQLVGGMQDNGTWAKFTADPQEEWGEAFGGDGAFTGISYNSLYASSQNGNLIRFELEGNEYSFAGNISPTPNDEDYLFVNPFIINPIKQDQLFVAARGRVFYHNDIRSNPSEGDWSEITNEELNGQPVSALGMSYDPEGVLYFGTRFGRLFKVTNTENLEGDIESIRLTTTGMPSGNISSIAVDPKDADRVVVTFSNYGVVSVWYSEDGGDSWASISGNLEENSDGSGAGPSIRSAAIMPDGSGGDYYFLGTSVGLFMTKELDGDNTVWIQQAANSVGNVVVSNIMVRPVEGMIMLSTHGNGTFLGHYDSEVVSNINYSFANDGRTVELRANLSYDPAASMSYQWIKDGVDIQGETNPTLVVSDGGRYQVRLIVDGKMGSGVSNTVEINLDGQPPVVTSIKRFNPSFEDVGDEGVVFQVTFDEPVVNVDINDFVTTGTSSGTIDNVAIGTDAKIYNVAVSNIGGSGALGLTVSSSSDISDESGNVFDGTIQNSESFNVTDATAPTAAIRRGNPTAEITDQFEVVFSVEFSENVNNVDVTDFVMPNALDNAEIVGAIPVEGTRVYEVKVSQIISDGVVQLSFAASQDIEDAAGNSFDGSLTVQQTYTIENVIAGLEAGSSKAANIQVDANPSAGQFSLTLPVEFTGRVEYNVVNASGISVASGEVTNYQSGDKLSIDIRGQADGLYIFEAAGNKGKGTVKLLKRTR